MRYILSLMQHPFSLHKQKAGQLVSIIRKVFLHAFEGVHTQFLKTRCLIKK